MESLKQLIQLRQQIRELEQKAKVIQEVAVLESLDLLKQQNNPKQVVLDNAEARVIVAFKTRYLKDEDDPNLARLADELKAHQDKLLKQKRFELETLALQEQKLEKQLDELQAKRQKLLTPKPIQLLKLRYESRRQELSYKEPELRVQLKQ